MKPIKFNSNSKSKSYHAHIEYLLEDYERFREKYFSKKCINHLQSHYNDSELLLTHSATAALEIIAHLLNFEKGDEIILPSFTFVSTANAFVRMGAKPIFVDIEAPYFNLNLKSLKKAINSKTKAIIAVHYAGHTTNLDYISNLCKEKGIFLIEDAAMSYGCSFKQLPLGSFGDFAAISFDITKQISAIQGGLLLVNNKKFSKKAHAIYHNGTNRADFEQGSQPYYEWTSLGSKYQMNELNAAYLYDQLQDEEVQLNRRIQISKWYQDALLEAELDKKITLLPDEAIDHNVNTYYIITKSAKDRKGLQNHLCQNNVEAFFHYIPLHLSQMGKKTGHYIGGELTEVISKQILRLPFHTNITEKEVLRIVDLIKHYYNETGK